MASTPLPLDKASFKSCNACIRLEQLGYSNESYGGPGQLHPAPDWVNPRKWCVKSLQESISKFYTLNLIIKLPKNNFGFKIPIIYNYF